MGRCWLGTDGQMELEKAKAWIADLNRRLLKDKVRFAVGGPSVGYSSTWSAWHEADSSFPSWRVISGARQRSACTPWMRNPTTIAG